MTSQKHTLKRTSIRFALAALALACTAGAASAGTRTNDAVTQSVRVQTSDLDLTTQAGVETLTRRINRATRQVCGPRPSSYGAGLWAESRSYRECRASARTMAIAAAENVGVRFADARPFTLAMRD